MLKNCANLLKRFSFSSVARAQYFSSISGKSAEVNLQTLLIGDLYTWGKNTGSLGYAVSQTVQSVMVPKKIPEFSGNVSKVVLGLSHSAVITSKISAFFFVGLIL